MKILFVTNYYPPSDRGWGYMQLCEEVADGLAARGHSIAVLTSTKRDGPEIFRSYPVHRLLTIDPDWQSERTAAQQFFMGRRRRERQAVHALRGLVDGDNPDLIFIWDAVGLPRVLLQAAEKMAPTVYYLAGYLPEFLDEYIAYWEAQPVRSSARWFKRPLSWVALNMLRWEGKPIRLKYDHVICVSDYVRRRLAAQGLISKNAVVVHNGVDLTTFVPSDADRIRDFQAIPISCLIAGRVVPDKGIHTVIDALSLLPAPSKSCTLTVLGDGPRPYVDELRLKVEEHNLRDVVTFKPPVPRDEMPEQLSQYDVLLLPSEYAEPIARSMQEAMAMGLLVIGTTTGGSGELLVHEQTGLVFEAGNSQSLASQMARVLADPGLAADLARAGQQAVRSHFGITATIDKIEGHLRGVCRNAL